MGDKGWAPGCNISSNVIPLEIVSPVVNVCHDQVNNEMNNVK